MISYDTPHARLLPSSLAAELQGHLSEEHQALASELAQALVAAIAGDPALLRRPALRPLLRALTGVEVLTEQVLLDFRGAQLGDVTMGDVAGRDLIKVTVNLPPPQLTPQERRDRESMIALMQASWKGPLSRLGSDTHLAVSLCERPDLVRRTIHLRYDDVGQPTGALLEGAAIERIFDECGGSLLITGAAGSGKSTLLLRLFSALLQQSRLEDTCPMPVILSLRSWASDQSRLEDWLVDELAEVYAIPAGLARAWLGDDRLQLLLDGLDEVGERHRAACVEAINRFHQSHLLRLAVCARTPMIADLPAPLGLRGAVEIQPLSAEQIQSWLHSEDDSGLRAAIAEQAIWRQMATTPLMLATMAGAFKKMSVAEVIDLNDPRNNRRLWDSYVAAAFRGSTSRYSQHQITGWLGWMARTLDERSRDRLVVHKLQPASLSPRARKRYTWIVPLAVSVVVALPLVSFAGSLSLALIWGVGLALSARLGIDLMWNGATDWPLRRRARIAALSGVSAALMLGPLFGLALAGMGGNAPSVLVISLIVATFFGISTCVATAMFIGLVGWLVRLRFGRELTLGIGLSSGLTMGLCAGASALVLVAITGKPGLVALAALITLIFGLQTGLCAELFSHIGLDDVPRLAIRSGLFIGVAVGLISYKLDPNLYSSLRAGVSFGCIALIAPRPRMVEIQLKDAYRQAWIALALGLLGWLLVGAIWGQQGAQDAKSVNALSAVNGPLVGLTFGLVLALRSGLAALLQHGVLRLLLYEHERLPFGLSTFLQEAYERALLVKVGVGYQFAHPLLHEYFARLGRGGEPPPDEKIVS